MEKFEIKNRKGLKIIGDVLMPKNPIGLSFVLHGHGGFRKQDHIQILAQTLFENKYTVVNFDATNSIGESGGKYEDSSLENHYTDLVDVINWAKTQSWYQEPFVLAGHSLGGYAVARYAEEFPKEVKAVFPYAAVFSGRDNFEADKLANPEEMRNWEKTGWKLKISTSKPGVEMRLPWSYVQEKMHHDLKPNAKNLTMPILFVVGENDAPCRPDIQKDFYNLLPIGTEKEFHIIKGAPHTFREKEHLEQLKNIFDSWLKKLK